MIKKIFLQTSETDSKRGQNLSLHEPRVRPLRSVCGETPPLRCEGQHHSLLHGGWQEREHDRGGAGGL